MLKVCEEYASGLDVRFNASKSKCIVCCPQYYSHHPAPRFSISGNTIETVDNWLHLGLWDLSNIAVQTLCATWRKALRRTAYLSH